MLLWIAAALPQMAAAATYRLPATGDTFVDSLEPDTNFGQAFLLEVDQAYETRAALYQFDLSVIPPGEDVLFATLQTQVWSVNDPPVGVRVQRVTVPWHEDTATWNSVYQSPDFTQHGFSQVRQLVRQNFEITDLVRDWHNGTANYGLSLVTFDWNDLVRFGSKESSAPPVLIVVTSSVSTSRVRSGSYIGNGGSVSVILDVAPHVVMVKSETSRSAVLKTATMDAGISAHLAGSGGFVAGGIQSLNSNGFKVGDSAFVNGPGTTYHYLAIEAAPGDVSIIKYTGDRIDGRQLPASGLPGYALIVSEAGTPATHRFGTFSQAFSLDVRDGDPVYRGIQGFAHGVVTIGDANEVNEEGRNFHGFVFADHFLASAGVVGNGRPVAGVPQAAAAFVASVDGGYPGYARFFHMTTDESLPLGDRSATAGVMVGLSGPDIVWGNHESLDNENHYFTLPVDAAVDIAVDKTASHTDVELGEQFTYHVSATNNGPDDATGVLVVDSLPGEVAYVGHSAQPGGYDLATGQWMLGDLPAGETATLDIVVQLQSVAGTSVSNTARLAALDQDEVNPTNDQATAVVSTVAPPLPAADVAITLSVDNPAPLAGQLIEYLLKVKNRGPDPATDLAVRDSLDAGLSLAGTLYSVGTLDTTSGVWTIGALAADSTATMRLEVRVGTGTEGMTLVNRAWIHARSTEDPIDQNDQDAAQVIVHEPQPQFLRVTAQQSAGVLVPGDAPSTVLRLALQNNTDATQVLQSLEVVNASTAGGATASQLDASWVGLQLRVGSSVVSPTVGFAGGVARFEGLDLPIPSGAQGVLEVLGGASLSARDGDQLDLLVESAAAFGFEDSLLALDSSWPLDPSGDFEVDGMSAAQIAVRPVQASTVMSGTMRNLVFDFVVPANGYADDRLNRLDVVSLGSAQHGVDIATIEAWLDDGDQVFDAASDQLLGELAYTGNRYELTGIELPVPAPGVRVFATCDIAATAADGRTIQLGLPASSDPGLGMVSANDGPNDLLVTSPSVQSITTADRVTAAAGVLAPATIHPGEQRLALELEFGNTYTVDKVLETVTLTNYSTGSGVGADLDGLVSAMTLYLDADFDSALDPEIDTPLGTSFFSNGRAAWGGLGLVLPAGESRKLFVEVQVSGDLAPDGDVVRVGVAGADDLYFLDAAALAASFPLDSGASLTVDGFLAEAVDLVAVGSTALAPGEGPALAFEAVLPANGYEPDVLRGVLLENTGSAAASDIGQLRLWADGGDGNADWGSGDDVDLGELAASGNRWVSNFLNQPVPLGGLRVYVSIVAAGQPQAGGIVELELPVGAVSMESGNDGPIDQPVAEAGSVVLSTVDLLTTLELSPVVSAVGQMPTATMQLRNVGSAAIDNIAPEPLEFLGDGGLEVSGGPNPPVVNLAPSAAATITWTLTATSAGAVSVVGSAAGSQAGTGATIVSLESESNGLEIVREADSVNLYTVESMPFSINRGQVGVVPLGLTFSLPSGSEASHVFVERLRFSLVDGHGNGVPAGNLVERLVINEGAVVYLDTTSLPDTGSEVDAVLSQPIVVSADAGASVSISLDIAPSTSANDFRVVVAGDTAIDAADATTGVPVAVLLPGSSFPVESGLGRIVTPANDLEVAAGPEAVRQVVRGTEHTQLLTFDLDNLDAAGQAAEIRLLEFGLAGINGGGQALALGNFASFIYVEDAAQTYLARAVSTADSTLALTLSPPVSVQVNAPRTLTVAADIRSDAPLAALKAQLMESASFDARDTNSGAPVAVTLGARNGDRLTILDPAGEVQVTHTANLAPAATLGDANVRVMELAITHPGGSTESAVRLNALTLELWDGTGVLLAPGAYLEGIRLFDETGQLNVEHRDLSGSVVPAAIQLPDPLLAPETTVRWSVALDFEATAPLGTVQLALRDGGLSCTDAVTGEAVTARTGSGSSFPLTSGLTQLSAPPTQLGVHFKDVAPPVLVVDGTSVRVAELELVNAAPRESGAVLLDRLSIDVADLGQNPLAPAELVSEASVFVNGEHWATTDSLSSDASSVIFVGATPIVVPPGEPVSVDYRLRWRENDYPGVRFRVESDDLGVVQSGGAIFTIAVVAETGNFPFWTAASHFTAPSLRDSFTNFPNPFAAGRQETHFSLFLPTPSRVTLVIRTLRGDVVETLTSGRSLPAGLWQELRWNGRNGRGDVVANGVYVADMRVDSGDRQERLLRKIAVVR